MKSLQSHTWAKSYFEQIKPYLSSELRNSSSENNIVFQPFDLYVAADVSTLSGSNDILDNSSKRLVGVCSFDETGKLNTNKAAIWDRLSVECGTGTAGDDPASVKYDKTMPAEIGNCELVFEQKNQEILRVLADTCKPRAAADIVGGEYRQLESPRFFIDNEPITISIETPKGQAIPTGNFIRLMIPALLTRKL